MCAREDKKNKRMCVCVCVRLLACLHLSITSVLEVTILQHVMMEIHKQVVTKNYALHTTADMQVRDGHGSVTKLVNSNLIILLCVTRVAVELVKFICRQTTELVN